MTTPRAHGPHRPRSAAPGGGALGATLLMLAFGCAPLPQSSQSSHASDPRAAPVEYAEAAEEVRERPRLRLHLAPNVRDRDGTPAYVHFAERDLPLVVELPLPERAARNSSPEETREAVVSAFRAWERALRVIQPEFGLVFVEEAPDPDLRVTWVRRPPAYLPAQGRITYRIEQAQGTPALRVAGQITLATMPLPQVRHMVSLGTLRVHALHAFGSALGLVDCHSCDSVMSDAWLRDRKFEVTDLDLLSYEALIRMPNGTRADGRGLRGLEEKPDPPRILPDPEGGVLADLPFINTGRGGTPYLDLAAPGRPSFALALDTGANSTILTDTYARALGISVRAAKTDPYRRSTVTGRPLEFWCTGQRVVGKGRGPTHLDYALLGGRFLRNFVVEIDSPGRRVRFLDPEVHRVGEHGNGGPRESVVDLRISENRPYAELRTDQGSVWALVDTGAEASVMLSEQAAARLGIEVDRNGQRVLITNVRGTQVAVRQKIPRATLGSLELEELEVLISLADESSFRIERTLAGEALIGIKLLEEFLVRLDYPRAKLGLTPN